MSAGPGQAEPLLHVALREPTIPNNTGSIGRTCVALGCGLHLIHPVGFDLSEKACRRAGLDYWPRLWRREHDDWASYEHAVGAGRMWLLSARASRPLFDAEIRPGDHLVFGSETDGLPGELLDRYADRAVCLPMVGGERSLNVAAAACAAMCEGVRQLVGRCQAAAAPNGRLRPAGRVGLGGGDGRESSCEFIGRA